MNKTHFLQSQRHLWLLPAKEATRKRGGDWVGTFWRSWRGIQ